MSQWRLVSVHRIDAKRWDDCVRHHNREIFSEYWYWNAVCSSWQAWVKGDYEDVLALPAERKWGLVPFMRTPLYVKWIEGDPMQLREQIERFFGFKRIHLPFEMFGAKKKSVQLLQLNEEWSASKELLKNVRKAEGEGATYTEEVTWEEFASFMKSNHPYQWPDVQQRTMQELYNAASDKAFGGIAGVKIQSEWAAMQFYICNNNKGYLIQNVVASKWRNREPMPFLLNTLFAKWQSQSANFYVNFMGSNNPGVARFNEKFGAHTAHYWEFP